MRHTAQSSAQATRFLPKPLALGIALVLSGGVFMAPSVAAETKTMPKVVVVGTEEGDIERQPGSVTIVTEEELQLRQPRSTEEALRAVPGVSIKGEEESAVVANIGVRGLSSADFKTLILEDGVPVAFDLFFGNGRYYNPRIQRMEGIEVLKGAASLRYGPSTIGGVINYITKQPKDGVEVSLRGGSWNTRETTLELGGTSPSQDAKFGAIVTRATSDGFMDKGYDMTDVMLKAGMAIGDNQWVSVKYSDYENDANISYRGLFLQEYENGARNNPAPDDYFLTGRRSIDINHDWEINSDAKLTTLVYSSQAYRDYWRYNTNNTASATQGRWVYLNTLNGNNRNNDRFGVDSRLMLKHQLFGIANEAEFGVRFLNEELHDQTISATRATPRTGTFSRDRIDSAESIAFFAQNRFILTDRFAVTAGVRAEDYEQSRKNLQAATNNEADTSNTEVLPGVGATYQFSKGLQGFTSVYEAFSPALNGDALDGLQDQQLDAERSVNFEAGVRGASNKLSYELTFFRMDFDNQIVPANSNTQFQRTNGGETLHQGLEAGLGWDLGAGFALKSSATYIPDAEFAGDRRDANGNITTPDGNRVTYVPEWVGNLSLEYTTGQLQTALSLYHTSSQFTDVRNTNPISESTTGFFTGQIKGYTLLDWSAVYDFTKELSVSASAKNLTDEKYIASLRQGIYVGVERSVDIGLKLKF